jgi:DNA adenine methylase
VRRTNSLLAFPWYGGKYTHLPFILGLIAASDRTSGPHLKFTDSFGGSAAVLLNKAPSRIECYNDRNGQLVNFFRVLRSHRAVLCEQLSLTPYSRAEYMLALNADQRCVSDIERARRFFIVARMTRNAMAESGASFRWSFAKLCSRRGMSKNVSAWFGGIEGLEDVAARLARVEMECIPASECIRLHDGPGTLHYVDPPYVHAARASKEDYGEFEMSEAAHEELAKTLNTVEGRVLLSGYDTELYRDLYPGWFPYHGPRMKVSASRCSRTGGQSRVEVVWANHELLAEVSNAKGKRPLVAHNHQTPMRRVLQPSG